MILPTLKQTTLQTKMLSENDFVSITLNKQTSKDREVKKQQRELNFMLMFIIIILEGNTEMLINCISEMNIFIMW